MNKAIWITLLVLLFLTMFFGYYSVMFQLAYHGFEYERMKSMLPHSNSTQVSGAYAFNLFGRVFFWTFLGLRSVPVEHVVSISYEDKCSLAVKNAKDNYAFLGSIQTLEQRDSGFPGLKGIKSGFPLTVSVNPDGFFYFAIYNFIPQSRDKIKEVVCL